MRARALGGSRKGEGIVIVRREEVPYAQFLECQTTDSRNCSPHAVLQTAVVRTSNPRAVSLGCYIARVMRACSCLAWASKRSACLPRARGASSLASRARGMRDYIGEEAVQKLRVQEIAFSIAKGYGFVPIETPIVEYEEVFSRTLGDDTDIVSKEMYSFVDKSGKPVVLRPENTAGVMRAFLSHDGISNIPAKYAYSGPMFRYERPQRGRYRQFDQFGVEMLGCGDSLDDVEALVMACETIESLGLEFGVDVELRINTLGDSGSRKEYREALRQYFDRRRSSLSNDSVARLERGSVMRILDSKDERDRDIISDAPMMAEYLSDDSVARFNEVCKGLSALDIDFTHDQHLVRGLDYYCHTAFEIVLGTNSCSAVLGGGRYDSLASVMGSNVEIPAVGWALGTDRLVAHLMQKSQNSTESEVNVAVVPIAEKAQLYHLQ